MKHYQLAKNNPKYHQAWMMAVKGHTYKQIGEVLGLSAPRVYAIIKVYRERIVPTDAKKYVKELLSDQCSMLQKELFDLKDKPNTSIKEQVMVINSIIKLNERLDKLHSISIDRTDITTGGQPLSIIVSSSTGEIKDEDI